MWQKIGGAALLAVVLTSCSGSSSESTQEIEQAIQKDMAKQLDMKPSKLTVDCPTTITWRVGEDFHCVAEADPGARVRVTVTMESDDGSYTWEAN